MQIPMYVIEIHLKNVGNGAAMCVYVNWKKGSDESERHSVYEDERASFSCYKEFQYDNTVASIGKEINVELLRKTKNEDNKPISNNSLVLPISYFDLIGNSYMQKIVIHFNIINDETGEIKPFDILPLHPSLIGDSGDN